LELCKKKQKENFRAVATVI